MYIVYIVLVCVEAGVKTGIHIVHRQETRRPYFFIKMRLCLHFSHYCDIFGTISNHNIERN